MSVVNLLAVQIEITAAFERACLRHNLSKRAALTILFLAKDGERSFSNEDLRRFMTSQRLSSEASVKKDASMVKGELLDALFIEVIRKTSIVRISPEGFGFVSMLEKDFQAAVEEARLHDDLKAALRWIGDLPVPLAGYRTQETKPGDRPPSSNDGQSEGPEKQSPQFLLTM